MTRWPPPPTLSASFYKGHGLGNDYLVFEEGDEWSATPANVRRVCDRHRGVGSDGIVVRLRGASGGDRDAVGPGGPPVGADTPPGSPVRLRMFNPDGTEFERSGNGLRVLASYLLRSAEGPSGSAPGEGASMAEEDPAADGVRVVPWAPAIIDVEVAGARIRMLGHGRDGAVHDVSVEMGPAEVGPSAIALDPDALDAQGRLVGPDGTPLRVVPVRVGNPHVVVLCDDESDLSEERLARVGPFIAEHPSIAHGTNVQLALHDADRSCRALIWERGVGRTSASGTSACAVAVAMVSAVGIDGGDVTVRMPGGELMVSVAEGLDVVLRGPAEEVAEGRLSPRFFG